MFHVKHFSIRYNYIKCPFTSFNSLFNCLMLYYMSLYRIYSFFKKFFYFMAQAQNVCSAFLNRQQTQSTAFDSTAIANRRLPTSAAIDIIFRHKRRFRDFSVFLDKFRSVSTNFECRNLLKFIDPCRVDRPIVRFRDFNGAAARLIFSLLALRLINSS